VSNVRILIITGLSGSGKSITNRALEDLGFFCIDNLPVGLLPKFLEMRTGSTSEISKIACVMDTREPHFLSEYPKIFAELRKKGCRIEILFLEASDEALIRRFSETRRPHPLAEGGTAADGIAREREMLSGLKKAADMILDSTDFSVHELRREVQHRFSQIQGERSMNIMIVSFGFKYGIPSMADLVMDVRFLPNPYFHPDLKDLSGEDPPVAEYVLSFPETKEFVDRYLEMLRFLMPFYIKEGKSYLTIAIGCTGGRHRSVALANELTKKMGSTDCQVKVRHRDIGRSD